MFYFISLTLLFIMLLFLKKYWEKQPHVSMTNPQKLKPLTTSPIIKWQQTPNHGFSEFNQNGEINVSIEPEKTPYEIELENRKDRSKFWMNIGIYILCFYIISSIIQLIAQAIYLNIHQIPLDQMNETHPLYNDFLIITGGYSNFIIYVVATALVIPVSWKFLKEDLYKTKKEIGMTLVWIIAGWFLMMALNFCTKIIVDLISNQETATNQATLEDIITHGGFVSIACILFVTLLAPVLEELIFRKSFFGIFKKGGMVVVLLSALLFASIHIIFPCLNVILTMASGSGTLTQLLDEFIYILVYFAQGVALSFVYYKSKKNIIPCIAIHFINNVLAVFSIFVLNLIS